MSIYKKASTKNRYHQDNQIVVDVVSNLPQSCNYSDEGTDAFGVVDITRHGSYQQKRNRWIVILITTVVIMLLILIRMLSTKVMINGRTGNDYDKNEKRKKKRITRLAVLRPFGTGKISTWVDSFSEWNRFLPCDSNLKHEYDDQEEVIVDIFVSFSQSFDNNAAARASADELLDEFISNRNTETGGWARCFRNFILIEAHIKPSRDLYLPMEAETNHFWVNGPNQQFYSSMEQIMKNKEEKYDAVFLIETDCVPIKQYWLDNFLNEAEKGDSFAILGSKYDGDSWDNFRSFLPLALQHHINGNAMYNLTHPLLREILIQLSKESDTPYNAVPYDYRISQILVEGMLGVKPDLPEKIVRKWELRTGKKLKDNSKRFNQLWVKYGSGKPVRESKSITNYASTNLLPHHLEEIKASLIHGAEHYLPWDRNKINITLVVSDWHDELAINLLNQIDSTNHPFSKLVILVPDDLPKQSLFYLSNIETKIRVTIQKRKNDFFDICNARVDTDWFMITNSYHIISERVDLLFTKRYKPVTSFIMADHNSCVIFPGCREEYEKSKQFDPNNRIIVQDNMILFKTKKRDEFCLEWKHRFGEKPIGIETNNSEESIRAMGPSATTYISYLSSKGALNDYYEFKDMVFYGHRDYFKRIFTESAEKAAKSGETPLANYILQKGSILKGQKLHMERKLQFFSGPTFSQVQAPQSMFPTSATSEILMLSENQDPTRTPTMNIPPLDFFQPYFESTSPSSQEQSNNDVFSSPPTQTPSLSPSLSPSNEDFTQPSTESSSPSSPAQSSSYTFSLSPTHGPSSSLLPSAHSSSESNDTGSPSSLDTNGFIMAPSQTPSKLEPAQSGVETSSPSSLAQSSNDRISSTPTHVPSLSPTVNSTGNSNDSESSPSVDSDGMVVIPSSSPSKRETSLQPVWMVQMTQSLLLLTILMD